MSEKLDFVELAVIKSNGTLMEAVAALDKSSTKLILVACEETRKVLASISDGDIRRALLSGSTMNSNVLDFANTDCRIVESKDDLSTARALLSTGYKAIPIGSSILASGKVEALVVRKTDLLESGTAALIFAGGKGTRLTPLTESKPKPLLEVDGKPMLQHQIDALKVAGIRNLVISVGYLKGQIIEHFGDGSDFDVSIKYIEETQPLGTAGSLKLLADKPNSLICLNADVISALDLENMLRYWEVCGADILTACQSYEHEIPFGVLEVKGDRIIEVEEKPKITKFINSGIYLLSRSVLEMSHSIPLTRFDMPYLIKHVIEQGGAVVPFFIHEHCVDVGTHDALNKIKGV